MRFHQNTGESQGKGDRAASDRQGSLDFTSKTGRGLGGFSKVWENPAGTGQLEMSLRDTARGPAPGSE